MSATEPPCLAPLFVPGDRPDRFQKAAACGADAIIIDLEDAVAPVFKERARQAVAGAVLPPEPPVYIRINPRHTPWYRDDLALAAALPGAGIVLPKVESTRDILSVHEGPAGERPVLAMIESAAGIAHARAIAAAAGVRRLAFGAIDYCADLGCACRREMLLIPRSELVLASRLAGLAPPLDGVSADLNDDEACRDDAHYAAQLGFGGKLCIHPRQVSQVVAGFMPAPEELAWARQLMERCPDGGAEAVAGEFVDAAVLRRARNIIERHRQLTAKMAGKNASGQKPGEKR